MNKQGFVFYSTAPRLLLGEVFRDQTKIREWLRGACDSIPDIRAGIT